MKVGVEWPPAINRDRPVHHTGIGRVAILQGCHIHQWLERGSGLAHGLGCPIELALQIVTPADHGLDGTGMIKRHQRALIYLRPARQVIERCVQRLLTHALQVRIDGRFHHKLARRTFNPHGQPREHPIDKICRPHVLCALLAGNHGGCGTGQFYVGQRQHTRIFQLVEHKRCPFQCQIKVVHRRKLRRRFGQSGNQRCLGQRQITHTF